MIQNELNLLQNISNDYANAVQRDGFQTAAATAAEAGSSAVSAIQHHYASLVQHNNDLEERLRETQDELERAKSAHVKKRPTEQ